jgi:hypothetical protein
VTSDVICDVLDAIVSLDIPALISKYYCYGGYTGWVVLDMTSLSFNIFPALSPNFLCNGMATDSATRSVMCTSLGQSTSW